VNKRSSRRNSTPLGGGPCRSHGRLGDVGLLNSEGFDHDADAAEQRVALPEDVGAKLALDDDRELEEIPGRDAAARGMADGLDAQFGIRLCSKDSDGGEVSRITSEGRAHRREIRHDQDRCA
jgi:hypothetical protein